MNTRTISTSESTVNMKDDEQFPTKLHRILDDAELNGFSDCISWMPDGTSFKILNKARLEEEVMPHYFTSCQFKSFQRSLNMWGFVADNKKSDTATGGGRRHHPLFVKGRPELCAAMRRVRVKKPGARGKKTLVVDKLARSDSPSASQEETVVSKEPIAQLIQENRSQSIDVDTDVMQQLSQVQPNALLYTLLAQKLSDDCQQAVSTSSPQAPELPKDQNTPFTLESTLAKILSTINTPSFHSPFYGLPATLQSHSSSSINISPGLSAVTPTETAVCQAAIALATSDWHSTTRNHVDIASSLLESQYRESLLFSMLRQQQQQQQQQQQAPLHSSVMSDSIRNLLFCNNMSHSNEYNGGHLTTSPSSTRPDRMNILGTSYSSLLNHSPLDLASSIFLQHHNANNHKNELSSSPTSY